jgi:integrase
VKTKDPDYVCGKPGAYKIQPPIVHPAFCVCAKCAKFRTFAQWPEEVVFRVYRTSKHPPSRTKSSSYALQVKRDEEAALREAVRAAEEQRRAKAGAVTFGRVVDAYRKHLQESGKRYDRARSRIDNIEALFGRERDAAAIGWDEYQELLAEVAELSAQSRRHYASTLLAMLNNAVANRIMKEHQLGKVPRPQVRKNTAPVTWTKRELAVILGPAMDQFEREQAAWNAKVAGEKANRGLRCPSDLPLRGFCYVAYFTLMRPKNNLALTWEEIDPTCTTFHLDQHKNVNRGIRADGPTSPQLAQYLRSIRPAGAVGPVHANPATGAPYVDIRKQWSRLVAIASDMLGYALTARKADFFTFRHTGASHLAEKTKNPILIAKMMGDTNVQTVMRHYFNLDIEFMAEMIEGWTVPTVDGRADEETEVAN